MSYLALARKYRPQNFQSFIGQEASLNTLINALDTNRLHHAYLFSGTHGIGKTSLARILAKAFNCEQGVSSRPCEKCSACISMNEGRFVDLIEVDAASKTKVEDTRELLDNVQYLPSRGRFKIYLIDEVHMLSSHSFNALLKTLEEPPQHVKFLLATTDPQKLPLTILSRCLQFHLRRFPFGKIVDHLIFVLHQEGFKDDNFEMEAIQEIATHAKGSMRDALSLLDQAIAAAYDGRVIRAVEVRNMLGLTPKNHLILLVNALIQRDAKEVMRCIHGLADVMPDFSLVLNELNTLIHQLALIQKVPELLEEFVLDREAILQLSKKVSPEELQLYYQIGLMGQRDLPYAPSFKMGFEMVLLRMLAFQPISMIDPVQKVPGIMAKIDPVQETLGSPIQNLQVKETQKTKEIKEITKTEETTETTDIETTDIETTETDNHWETIINQLTLTGMTKELAQHCTINCREKDFIHLILDKTKAPLLNKRNEERLCEALEQYFGKPCRLKITMSEGTLDKTPRAKEVQLEKKAYEQAKNAIENDPKVQSLMNTFDAVIEKIES